MAHLTRQEFQQAVGLIVKEIGVSRFRDRLVRMRAFVSGGGADTEDRLAEKLYRLTGGLRLQVGPTIGFHTVWNGIVEERLGEDGEQNLEKLAEPVNACLDARERIIAGKEAELDAALQAYREALAATVGEEMAHMDMLLKAVPDVARRLREGAVASPPPASASAEG